VPFKTVLVKGLGKVKFPGDMADDAIAASIKNLDMSEAARMARAKKQGFGDAVYSHFSEEMFDEFNPSFRGSNTIDNASSPGLAISSLVGDFANRGGEESLSSVFGGGRRRLMVPDRDRLYEVDSLTSLSDELENHARDVMGMADDEIEFPDDAYQTYKKISDSYRDELEAQGYRGVVFPDEEFGGESVAIFRPENIRDVDAAFNPDARKSPSLLASSAPFLLAGGLSMFSSSPAEASVTGTIEGPAPGRENIAKVSDFIDRHDDIVFDDLLGGVTSWLNKLSYDDKLTFKDRLMAALDLM
jgi:hypothetical protein